MLEIKIDREAEYADDTEFFRFLEKGFSFILQIVIKKKNEKLVRRSVEQNLSVLNRRYGLRLSWKSYLSLLSSSFGFEKMFGVSWFRMKKVPGYRAVKSMELGSLKIRQVRLAGEALYILRRYMDKIWEDYKIFRDGDYLKKFKKYLYFRNGHYMRPVKNEVSWIRKML